MHTGVPQGAVWCSALVAKDAFELELAALRQSSGFVVVLVGDQLNPYCAQMAECEVGESSDGLTDEAVSCP